MILTDGKLLLRLYRADDVEPMYEAVRESIPELSPWMPWCTENYSRKEARDWVFSREKAWLEEEEFSFVMTDMSGERFLGGVGLNGINRMHRWANLGYWVRSSEAGRGLATAATRMVGRWGLREMGFARLEILADVENRASQRVAEKAGALREGIMRKRLFHLNKSHDAALFSIVGEDLL